MGLRFGLIGNSFGGSDGIRVESRRESRGATPFSASLAEPKEGQRETKTKQERYPNRPAGPAESKSQHNAQDSRDQERQRHGHDEVAERAG